MMPYAAHSELHNNNYKGPSLFAVSFEVIVLSTLSSSNTTTLTNQIKADDSLELDMNFIKPRLLYRRVQMVEILRTRGRGGHHTHRTML